jgi:hypothetical protein
MASPLEAIVVRFGAEWTGGAVVNRVVSDLSRIMSAGKETGDALSLISKAASGGSMGDAAAHQAAAILKWQSVIRGAKADIAQLGAAMALPSNTEGHKTLEEGAYAFQIYAGQIANAEKALAAATPAATGFGAALATSLPYIVGVGAALTAGVAAFKQWAEAARQGAEVRQLSESFQFLTTEIYKTPDALAAMRTAARGTISDAQLMSSYLTLTAGVSQDLGQELTKNAPQLLEIAKAANVLNPTLGDTTYFFESLARGIKRSEIRLIDNLGLIIKVGEAQKRYAESIGVSERALSAEQKQIAILNEVLRVGGNLIDQVGGNMDSLVDPYLKWNAETENIRNNLNSLASITFAPLAAEGAKQIAIWSEFSRTIVEVAASMREASGQSGAPKIEWAETIFRISHAAPSAITGVASLARTFGFLTEAVSDFNDMTRVARLGISPNEWFNVEFERNIHNFVNKIRELAGLPPIDMLDKVANFDRYVALVDEANRNPLAVNPETKYIYAANAEALREWTDEMQKAAIEQAKLADFNIKGVDGANQLGIQAIARQHINNILKEQAQLEWEAAQASAGAHAEMQANIRATRQALEDAGAARRAAIAQDMTEGWMNAFAGGEFNSELIIGDIRKIGTAWVTTSNATQEQTDKLAELRRELVNSRDKLWDMENGIGTQGSTAEATTKKIEKLRGEIANYERVIAEMESGITYSRTQKTTALNLDDMEVYKSVIESFGNAGAAPQFLSELAVKLGYMGDEAAEAMLKMALLQGVLANLPTAVKAGIIDPSEITSAINEIIAMFESEKTVAEIEVEIQAKVDTANIQKEIERTTGPWIPREERGVDLSTNIEVGADITPGERMLQYLLGGVEGSKAEIGVTANTDPARAEVDNLIADISGKKVEIQIIGTYTPPANMPDGNPGGVPPESPYQAYRTGGYIAGSKGRKMAIIAHAGEYVLRPEAVEQLGVGFLNQLNQGYGSASNSVSVQNNFYGAVEGERARTVIVQSAHNAADQLEKALLETGYRI